MNFNRKSETRDYVLIILGSFIMGFAIKNIYDPVGLVTGGVSGLAIIFKNQFGVALWVTNTVLNIPLFLFSIRLKGWRFIKRTLIATVTLSLSLYVIPEIPFLMDDLFLTALFGGLISGVGAGLVFVCQATTGGTDMLAALIQRKYRHYSIAQIMQVLDAVIVLVGAGIFGVTYALYALIAIFAVAKVSDGIIEGLKFSKVAFIISEKSEEISRAVMAELDRGVTGLHARGMYSGAEKNVLFCVVSKKEIVQLKELVVGHDSQAFVIVTDAREVLGEGFIEFRQ
ncbi:YitT family protein [Clostridium sp. AN503]|uniref:YitT family protein n=1 Tax=Clostridium sp. AN503 TaxID=3160598 RepID=UPI003457E437